MTAPSRPASWMRVGAGLVIAGVLLNTFGLVTGISLLTPADSATAAEESSAVTQTWASGDVVGARDTSGNDYDTFKDLSVTVSQTTKLSDQGVTISWSGAKATSAGEFATNYMQIMQCWGDAATGPTPDQCQFGASSATVSNLLGTSAASRSLGRKGSDPLQTYDSTVLLPTNPSRPNAKNYAQPFTPVSGSSVFDISDYFASATTNEVDAVRTGSDGTGQSVFQVQTSLTAPHLGCGAQTSSGTTRSCWIVVVPRGEYNTSGTPASDNIDGRVTGSPLSQSAWNNRMVFSMSFLPTSSSCTIGAKEVRVVGNEQFTDAMTSWQSAICSSGTTLGYSQLGDDEAKNQLTSTSSGAAKLAVVSSSVSTSSKVAYAPLSQNAIVVAYQIDRNFTDDSSLASKNGTPVTNLTFNARLIAKLLTQSYRIDVPGGGSKAPITNNPYTIVQDPEFIALNPEFTDFKTSVSPEGLIVSLGSGDDIAEVWNWLKSDPQASAFLKGKADDWGMTINPAYKSLNITSDTSINSFPKADLSIAGVDTSTGATGYGTLNLRPYSDDFADSAARAAKADAGAKIVWDVTKSPAQYVSGGSQLPGQRFELALTTLTSAERYGLNVAKLVNAANQAVAPTEDSITTSISSMTADTTTTTSSSSASASASAVPTATVAEPNFTTRVLDSYPLATVSYAAVSYCSAASTDLKGYAKLLAYAAKKGQITGRDLGELPVGYVPLSSAQKKQVAALAEFLADSSSVKAVCHPSSSASPSASPSASASSNSTDGTVLSSAEPVEAPASEAAAESTSAEAAAQLYAGDTASESVGIQGAAVVLSFAMGLPALLTGGVLLRKGRRLSKLRL